MGSVAGFPLRGARSEIFELLSGRDKKNLAHTKTALFGKCVRRAGRHRKNLFFLDVLNANGYLT